VDIDKPMVKPKLLSYRWPVPDPAILTTFPNTVRPNDRVMLGIGLRLAAMFMLAIMFVFVKLASQNSVHITESLFWRQLTGLPAVILWLWWNNDLASINTTRPGAHALRMVLGISAMFLNFSAMALLPFAQATTIGFATPIFATLFAAIILQEPTGRYRYGAVGLGFIGVVIAMRPSEEIVFSSSMIALAGAIITAAVSIQLRRMSRTESTGAIVFWFSLFSLLPLGIGVFFFGGPHDVRTWLYLAGLSIAGAIAQILLTSAMRHAPVAVILTMDYSSLIWAILFGILIFGDAADVGVWIGAPIIMSAGLLIAWREHYLAHQQIHKG
jgi:drug/metabolite transporter (DMT)-like permease